MGNVKFKDEIKSYFKEFENYLKMLNWSIKTIKSYRSTFNSFFEFIDDYDTKELDFANMKLLDIINFLEYKNVNLQKQSELKVSCKKLYIKQLKFFFKFTNSNFNTNLNIKEIFDIKIKLAKETPKGVEEENLIKLKEYLENIKLNSFLNVKRSIFLKILLYTGCRRGELASLKVQNFVKEDDIFIIKVLRKGSKEGVLYIPSSVIQDELEYYLSNDIEYIATSKTGKQMKGEMIYKFLNNTYKKIGVDIRGIHILRHTFAKEMLKNGVNIVNVKELLGHSNLQTTMIYLNPHEKEVRNAYKRALDIKS